METKRFKPLVDKLFFWIWIPTILLLAVATVISACGTLAIIIMIAADLFCLYFLVSALFGYAELRETTLFVKFGFIIKREIPYYKILSMKKERKFYTETMLSLKNALDHVTVKYNHYDFIAISVVDLDEFISELALRVEKSKE